MTSNARISRVGSSWRVRVFGHPPKFFADGTYGSTDKALRAARAWRDKRWDGKTRSEKLTEAQRRAIGRSKGDYKAVAARYGIAPSYVHILRRKYAGD